MFNYYNTVVTNLLNKLCFAIIIIVTYLYF